MKTVIALFALLGTLAFGCPNSGCGDASMQHHKSVMGTLGYALNIMKLDSDPEVQMALQGYRSAVAAIPSGMDTDAFKEGAFDRKMFVERSKGVRTAEAQADLFEKLYTLLDAEQKQRLHQLMAAHQYYMGGFGPRQSPCGNMGGMKCGGGKCGMGSGCPAKANTPCPGPGKCDCGCAKGAACDCPRKPAGMNPDCPMRQPAAGE